jgi:hypothetical protein
MTIALQPGLPTAILQSVVYALPPRAVVISSDNPVTVGQSFAGPFTAYVAGSFTNGSFLQCPTAATVVTCKTY